MATATNHRPRGVTRAKRARLWRWSVNMMSARALQVRVARGTAEDRFEQCAEAQGRQTGIFGASCRSGSLTAMLSSTMAASSGIGGGTDSQSAAGDPSQLPSNVRSWSAYNTQVQGGFRQQHCARRAGRRSQYVNMGG